MTAVEIEIETEIEIVQSVSLSIVAHWLGHRFSRKAFLATSPFVAESSSMMAGGNDGDK